MKSNPFFHASWILLSGLLISLIIILPKDNSFAAGRRAQTNNNSQIPPASVVLGSMPRQEVTSMTDQELRDLFAQYGITTNFGHCSGSQGRGCTNLDNLGVDAVDGLIELRNELYQRSIDSADPTYPSFNGIVISGGTEGEGSVHVSHGYGLPVLDLHLSPALDAYVRENGTFLYQTGRGPLYQIGDDLFLKEGNHWHVVFGEQGLNRDSGNQVSTQGPSGNQPDDGGAAGAVAGAGVGAAGGGAGAAGASPSPTTALPFGGPIVKVVACNNGGLWLTIDNKMKVGVKPLLLFFQGGLSRLNEYYNIASSGACLLGTYLPGGTCVLGNTTVPMIGTITPYPQAGVGTSKIPSFCQAK